MARRPLRSAPAYPDSLSDPLSLSRALTLSANLPTPRASSLARAIERPSARCAPPIPVSYLDSLSARYRTAYPDSLSALCSSFLYAYPLGGSPALLLLLLNADARLRGCGWLGAARRVGRGPIPDSLSAAYPGPLPSDAVLFRAWSAACSLWRGECAVFAAFLAVPICPGS